MINFLPRGIHFENYKQVLGLSGLPTAAMISVARTVIGTALTVLSSAFLGFMFTQEKMWGRKFWYRFMVITMYFNAGMIPMFITMKNLHLTNTFWVYILPAIVQPFNIVLVKTYVESIPRALQEAAEIDGAGIFKIFYKIILPACTPIMATVAIFAAVAQWNSFQDTLIYITDQKLYSLQYLVSLVVNKESEEYIHVKVDTENYRQRRKETLENLAKNIAYKVKRTKRSISLEPMNPYERRIIHSALQNDKYVTTHSEGEEPFRRVVVTLKR